MCETEGVGFVGPASELIRNMGDKIEAKKIARRAGVPTVPGSVGAIAEYAEAVAVASEVGYPLLIKAAAGGGGRGMRVVESAETLERDLARSCRRPKSPSVTLGVHRALPHRHPAHRDPGDLRRYDDSASRRA